MNNREDFESAIKEVLEADTIEFDEGRNCYKDFAIQLAFYIWEKAKEKYAITWISVDDRMPGQDAEVNFICDDSVFVGRYDDGFFTEDGWELLSVKHWVPLPTSPSAQGEE